MICKIYGSSDDLIEIEGGIREEFDHYFDGREEEEKVYLAFSDGTLLHVQYDGVWRFTPIKKGTAEYSKEEAEGADSDNYSDLVTLKGDIYWVALATHWAGRSR
jgi:hypothetical protein